MDHAKIGKAIALHGHKIREFDIYESLAQFQCWQISEPHFDCQMLLLAIAPRRASCWPGGFWCEQHGLVAWIEGPAADAILAERLIEELLEEVPA